MQWWVKHARSATSIILLGHLLHTIFNTLWLSSEWSTSVLHTVHYTLKCYYLRQDTTGKTTGLFYHAQVYFEILGFLLL